MSSRYTVRFSVEVAAESFEQAAEMAWRDVQVYAPMVDVTNETTGESDSVDLDNLDA